jgi:hypothetical protein
MQQYRNIHAAKGEHIDMDMQRKGNTLPAKAEHFSGR